MARSVPSRLRLATVAMSALALVASACGSASTEDPAQRPAGAEGAAEEAVEPVEPVVVVATTSILGDVVEQLVGDDGEVTVLMGPGVDPHGYAPSARDAATMREADLVVANGLQLEESLVSTLAATEEAGVPVFELAPLVDPLEFELAGDHGDEDGHGDEDEHGHGDEDDHDHGPEDPHVWFDPERMATGVELLAAELAEVAPQIDAAEWEARGAAYAAEIREVDAELAAAFDQVPADRRVIVTNHDSLGYLAARYDLEVVGTVVPGSSTQVEADPRSFSELVATVERAGIDVIFAENTDSTRLAEQLANEVLGRSDVEVEVVEVATDALGEPGSATDSYLGLLRETGTTIASRLARTG